jgi:molybdopterin-containing oxidoreductase family iron-sulfur binding subunit
MSASARDYWRSLEELAESPEFSAIIEREVPRFREVLQSFDRRRFLQLMAAPLMLAGLAGCGPEPEPRQLLPYVEQPPGIVPGRARYYATAMTRDGYAEGVLLQHLMGRPIKVEGNPDHPASLGAASALMQASILSLYDPRRAQSIVGNGQIAAWQAVVTALYDRRRKLLATGGKGLFLLSGAVTSPTLRAQIADLQRQFPAMRWLDWEPLDRSTEREADQRMFGRAVERIFDVGAADIIFAIESDLISTAPGALAYARQFAARRRPAETGGKMSRVYAIESTPTLLGAKADHRLPLTPAGIAAALRYLAAATGAAPQDAAPADPPRKDWLDAAAQDLNEHRGRILVHAGREQPTEVHLLADAINDELGGLGTTVRLVEPVAAAPRLPRATLDELAADMAAGNVDTLLMIDTNPVYSASGDLDFKTALAGVPFSLSLSLYADETALASTWRIPKAHEYEAWSDARAFDGTATIQQPQVRPLYSGRSPHEVLAVLQGDVNPNPLQIVRATWERLAEQEGCGNFDEFWHEALRSGIVENTAAAAIPVALDRRAAQPASPVPRRGGAGLQLLFRADEGSRDGRFADNGWLLEMPRPFTRLTWDNAALIAPETAERLDLKTEDVIEIATAHGRVRAPVFVLPGQAADCVTLPLGFGRRAGGLGVGVGFDAFRLRGGSDLWMATATAFTKTGEHYRLATTQGHDRVAGHDLIREGTLAQFNSEPESFRQEAGQKSLYPEFEYPRQAWAMAIDLNSCIGCQACVIACQAENNIPTVGKELVLQQRVMHWLRIDRYYRGPAEDPSVAFEPMPCMHCEKAPCEVVCPVHATVHDSEGLNLMVYNRCVGTRFCSNNCPYKVRRFNFFAFAMNEERPPESWNPEVSVRGRGVMEKCTYCIQRIRTAAIAADREDRKLRDGQIVTACQQSCPTQAIVFGDRNDRDSAVAKRKATPLDYVLLEELNTRPRTSYTALVRNRNPAIRGEEA